MGFLGSLAVRSGHTERPLTFNLDGKLTAGGAGRRVACALLCTQYQSAHQRRSELTDKGVVTRNGMHRHLRERRFFLKEKVGVDERFGWQQPDKRPAGMGQRQ